MYVGDDAGQAVLSNIRGLLDSSESFLDAAIAADISDSEAAALRAAVDTLSSELAAFTSSDIELGASASAIGAATAHLLQVQNALTYSPGSIARTSRILESTTNLLKALQTRNVAAVAMALVAIRLPWPLGPA
jgi:hypothetical protein